MNLNFRRAKAVCIIFTAAVLFALSFYFTTINNAHPSDTFDLDTGWSVLVGGEVYEDVDLELLVFEQQNKGDIIIEQRTLPDAQVDNPVLRIYVIHSAVEVSLDGELLYSYGLEDVAKNKMVGYGYHFINLPADYVGKELVITIYVNENDAFSNLESPSICNNDTMIRDFVIENRLALSINLFLFVFGMCLLPISVCFSVRQPKFINLTYVALFSVGISLWSLCNYDLIILFTYDPKVKAYLEFVSLYLVPIFVLLYFKDSLTATGHKWTTVLFWGTASIQLVFDVAAIMLHLLNILHFPAVLRYEHIILFLMLSNMATSIAFDIIHKQLRKLAIIIGMTVFIIFALLDLFKFNIEKYLVTNQAFHYVSFLCVGTLIFVISQIIDFCREISQMLYASARSRALEDMAYTDSLTGIFNRRKCEEEFNQMNGSGKTFGMISFDLNNLKTTNDTKGHEMGDLLIRSFAEILQNTFGSHGIVCRMGGDEFIVLFPDMTGINLSLLYEDLSRNIDSTNAQIPNLDISTAYGFCDNSSHPEWKSTDVYREADALMYRHKVAMKGGAAR